MNILLTFTGFHDPYSKGLLGDEEQPGPIITLVNAKSFDRVILFSTPKTEKITFATEKSIRELHPDIDIEIKGLPLEDPTDYIGILKGLRKNFDEISSNALDAKYFISVASGTPQMHACWLLLVSSGEIPAHILHTRPPRFVTKDRPIISDVDLTLPEFPIVRSNILNIDTVEDSPDVNKVIAQLGIVGDHPSIAKALENAATLAQSAAPMIILGETGTGKEVFAKFIHLLSNRTAGQFVPINCAAIPEALVESLLFGHKKGSFTGATTDQLGKFDQADGGTLFLDELGELPLTMQAKLLRVLQDGLVEPVGDKQPHKVDVRIVAATNMDLGMAIKEGQFREDLYYRLHVGEIKLPPLRERKSDIPKLALHVLDRINTNLKRHKKLSPGALSRLQTHSWPGNVRDLANVVERSALLSRNNVLEADDLMISEPITKSDPLAMLPEPSEGFSLEGFLTSARKQMLLKALETSDGNQSKAARMLGVTPQAVHKFIQGQ
jgi:transcriptional regulator with PAS, ATPase and Fis domain